MSESLNKFLRSEDGQEKIHKTTIGVEVYNMRRDNPYDENLYELDYTNIYLEPVREILSANQFVNDGDLWTEVD